MPYEAYQEDCGKVEDAELCLQVVLNILVRQTVLNLHIWEDILNAVDPKRAATLLTPIFTTVVQTERVELIELFCSYGFNPFSRPQGIAAPAIFGLVKEPSNIVNFTHIFDAIFGGMRKYFMRVVAGLKEYDFSSSLMNNARVWQDSGTLLDKAVKHNSNFARYLIKHSNPKVGTPLHWAVLVGDLSVIDELVSAGLSPYDEGSLYLSNDDLWKRPTLASRFIDESLHDKRWWENVDPDQLSTMRKEPISEFLYQCFKTHLADSSTSLETNVGSDTDDQSKEEEMGYLPLSLQPHEEEYQKE